MVFPPLPGGRRSAADASPLSTLARRSVVLHERHDRLDVVGLGSPAGDAIEAHLSASQASVDDLEPLPGLA
jgi:hypothetical protein